MNLAFDYQNPVHHFVVSGNMNDHDLNVIRSALYRLFESNPEFVVLNLSQAENIQTLPRVLTTPIFTELTNLALSKNIFFKIARTEIDATEAVHEVLELALAQKEKLLSSKNKVKEEIKSTVKKLFEENEELKKQLNLIHHPEVTADAGSLTSILDRFWNLK